MESNTELYYIRLDIYNYSNTNSVLRAVWCGEEMGWVSLDLAYEQVFRPVVMKNMKDIYDVKNEIEKSDNLPPDNKKGSIELSVKNYWYTNTYVFWEWDKEKGKTNPISVIRADSWFKARDYFYVRNTDKFVSELQVVHISECKKDYNQIKDMELEVDLIQLERSKSNAH